MHRIDRHLSRNKTTSTVRVTRIKVIRSNSTKNIKKIHPEINHFERLPTKPNSRETQRSLVPTSVTPGQSLSFRSKEQLSNDTPNEEIQLTSRSLKCSLQDIRYIQPCQSLPSSSKITLLNDQHLVDTSSTEPIQSTHSSHSNFISTRKKTTTINFKPPVSKFGHIKDFHNTNKKHQKNKQNKKSCQNSLCCRCLILFIILLLLVAIGITVPFVLPTSKTTSTAPAVDITTFIPNNASTTTSDSTTSSTTTSLSTVSVTSTSSSTTSSISTSSTTSSTTTDSTSSSSSTSSSTTTTTESTTSSSSSASSTTTSTDSTTSSSASSTTTTSTDSTTSSSVSSTTTTSTDSTTSSSTSSTTTTSTESTTSTSTSTESTTSSSTSSTTSTKTTSTTTFTTTVSTTTAASTITITSNPCTTNWSGIQPISSCVNCSIFPFYYQLIINYTAIATQSRIAFAFRQQNSFFALDDLSVRSFAAPSVEILINGGFETGDLTGWSYCNQYNASNIGGVKSNASQFTYFGFTYYSKSGSYYYVGGSNVATDYISQIFSSTIGQKYTITMHIMYAGTGSSSADLFLGI